MPGGVAAFAVGRFLGFIAISGPGWIFLTAWLPAAEGPIVGAFTIVSRTPCDSSLASGPRDETLSRTHVRDRASGGKRASRELTRAHWSPVYRSAFSHVFLEERQEPKKQEAGPDGTGPDGRTREGGTHHPESSSTISAIRSLPRAYIVSSVRRPTPDLQPDTSATRISPETRDPRPTRDVSSNESSGEAREITEVDASDGRSNLGFEIISSYSEGNI